MTTKEKILSSLEPVIANPQFVTINDQRIGEIAKELRDTELPPWDNTLQFLGTPKETAQYYFFLDSVNFCFWGIKGVTRWEYQVNGEWIGGYYAYSRAIKDAFVRDPRFFDAEFVSQMPLEDFKNIFKDGRNELLLVEERLEILHKNFRILKDEFSGEAINILERADYDADSIIRLLCEKFSTFRDESTLDGHTAIFLKRAQIFCSDLSFTGLPELAIKDLDHLCAFADYKLPQLLESFGILTYSPELNDDIVSERLIPAHSRKEVELRASAVVAIEQMKIEMERLGRTITTNELDWTLWVKAKATTFEKPHHKTLTTFY